jgi:hypothetical protein
MLIIIVALFSREKRKKNKKWLRQRHIPPPHPLVAYGTFNRRGAIYYISCGTK